MSVTRLVSQLGMSKFPAAPQSAPPAEQHFSPVASAARQFITAVFSAALSANGALQATVSVRVPLLHDLLPDRV